MNLYGILVSRSVVSEPSRADLAPHEVTAVIGDTPVGGLPVGSSVRMRMPRGMFGEGEIRASVRHENKTYFVLHQSPAHALDMVQKHLGETPDLATVRKIGASANEESARIISVSDEMVGM